MQQKLHGFVEHLRKSGAGGQGIRESSRSRIKNELKWIKLEKVKAAMTIALLPCPFIFLGELSYRFIRVSAFALLGAIGGILLLWKPIKGLVIWLNAGAHIPVLSKHRVGVERLGLMVGCVLSGPLFGVLYWSEVNERYSGQLEYLSFLPTFLVIGFLAGKLLIRASFWVVDGFKG